MLGAVLIPIENGRGVKTYGLNYNNIHTMRNTLICLVTFAFHFYSVVAELEFYPGFRRPDPIFKWEKEQSAEEYALEQFTKYLQEQQRRLAMQREAEPEFTFRVPVRPMNKEDTEFAVAPPDPRYYQPSPEDYDFLEGGLEKDEPEHETEQTKREPERSTVKEPILIKTRTDEIRPAPGVHHIREQDLTRFGMAVLPPSQSVDIRPVSSSLQDDTAGVYIIAVVAGISAAATVGLIAFAIGWYNLQKNVKNASDVEYPAYGVTGPNKDVSPTGDRRLAQSAQMYHYQHQKQQIIAMESRAAATVRHGSMSEAESDEENEEGDYTVYECPGLAPTGEMEVKNPLFQDDPTPAAQPSAKDEDPLPDQK